MNADFSLIEALTGLWKNDARFLPNCVNLLTYVQDGTHLHNAITLALGLCVKHVKVLPDQTESVCEVLLKVCVDRSQELPETCLIACSRTLITLIKSTKQPWVANFKQRITTLPARAYSHLDVLLGMENCISDSNSSFEADDNSPEAELGRAAAAWSQQRKREGVLDVVQKDVSPSASNTIETSNTEESISKDDPSAGPAWTVLDTPDAFAVSVDRPKVCLSLEKKKGKKCSSTSEGQSQIVIESSVQPSAAGNSSNDDRSHTETNISEQAPQPSAETDTQSTNEDVPIIPTSGTYNIEIPAYGRQSLDDIVVPPAPYSPSNASTAASASPQPGTRHHLMCIWGIDSTISTHKKLMRAIRECTADDLPVMDIVVATAGAEQGTAQTAALIGFDSQESMVRVAGYIISKFGHNPGLRWSYMGEVEPFSGVQMKGKTGVEALRDAATVTKLISTAVGPAYSTGLRVFSKPMGSGIIIQCRFKGMMTCVQAVLLLTWPSTERSVYAHQGADALANIKPSTLSCRLDGHSVTVEFFDGKKKPPATKTASSVSTQSVNADRSTGFSAQPMNAHTNGEPSGESSVAARLTQPPLTSPRPSVSTPTISADRSMQSVRGHVDSSSQSMRVEADAASRKVLLPPPPPPPPPQPVVNTQSMNIDRNIGSSVRPAGFSSDIRSSTQSVNMDIGVGSKGTSSVAAQLSRPPPPPPPLLTVDTQLLSANRNIGSSAQSMDMDTDVGFVSMSAQRPFPAPPLPPEPADVSLSSDTIAVMKEMKMRVSTKRKRETETEESDLLDVDRVLDDALEKPPTSMNNAAPSSAIAPAAVPSNGSLNAYPGGSILERFVARERQHATTSFEFRTNQIPLNERSVAINGLNLIRVFLLDTDEGERRVRDLATLTGARVKGRCYRRHFMDLSCDNALTTCTTVKLIERENLTNAAGEPLLILPMNRKHDSGIFHPPPNAGTTNLWSTQGQGQGSSVSSNSKSGVSPPSNAAQMNGPSSSNSRLAPSSNTAAQMNGRSSSVRK